MRSVVDRVGNFSLRQEVFNRATEYLKVQSTVDLLASDHNHKCNRYLTLPGLQGERACGWDDLRFSWISETAYALPPIQLIPRVLKKLWMEKREALMVVPEWPSRPWWNLLQEGVTSQVRLGKAEVALQLGSGAAEAGFKLPPGNMIMARICYN
jgi:hypothetical protein